jgi:hypothetical protein
VAKVAGNKRDKGGNGQWWLLAFVSGNGWQQQRWQWRMKIAFNGGGNVQWQGGGETTVQWINDGCGGGNNGDSGNGDNNGCGCGATTTTTTAMAVAMAQWQAQTTLNLKWQQRKLWLQKRQR